MSGQELGRIASDCREGRCVVMSEQELGRIASDRRGARCRRAVWGILPRDRQATPARSRARCAGRSSARGVNLHDARSLHGVSARRARQRTRARAIPHDLLRRRTIAVGGDVDCQLSSTSTAGRCVTTSRANFLLLKFSSEAAFCAALVMGQIVATEDRQSTPANRSGAPSGAISIPSPSQVWPRLGSTLPRRAPSLTFGARPTTIAFTPQSQPQSRTTRRKQPHERSS